MVAELDLLLPFKHTIFQIVFLLILTALHVHLHLNTISTLSVLTSSFHILNVSLSSHTLGE